jgi:hypothetical protein
MQLLQKAFAGQSAIVPCLTGERIRILGIKFDVAGGAGAECFSVEYQVGGPNGVILFQPSTGDAGPDTNRVSMGIGMVCGNLLVGGDPGIATCGLPDVTFDVDVLLNLNSEGSGVMSGGVAYYERIVRSGIKAKAQRERK